MASTNSTQDPRIRHGHSRSRTGKPASPEWTAWSALLGRTIWRTRTHKSNRRYSERNVSVCHRWKTFEHFLSDMGVKPSATHSVERIDNEGHYSCGKCEECRQNGWSMNCKWATPSEQSRNRCDNHMLTHDGRTMCLTDWALEVGIAPCTLYDRIKRGWDVGLAVTTPHSRPPAIVITFNGVTQTSSEWAKDTGIGRGVINARIRRGWTAERALTTPVSNQV